MKSCCEHHGINCNQGRLCPEREIHPPGWGHSIVLAMLAALIALVTGIVLVAKWLG